MSVTAAVAQDNLLCAHTQAAAVATRLQAPHTQDPPGFNPSTAPLLLGQFGVRSPSRYGRKLTPSAPAASFPARAVISS